MLKRGFTLAEVLITLLIVGVVATLTTPALVKNVGSSKIGPQLAKFVNTWETGTETFMMEESISRLADENIHTFGTSGMKLLSKYIIMTNLNKIKSPTSITLKNASGDDLDFLKIDLNSDKVWQLKDGTLVYFDQRMEGWFYYPSGSYKGFPTAFFVDIGGIKGSHRLGKEVFYFLQDSSGVLVPYGSNAHKSLLPEFTYNCSLSSSDFRENLACTGAVADNGYKAPW